MEESRSAEDNLLALCDIHRRVSCPPLNGVPRGAAGVGGQDFHASGLHRRHREKLAHPVRHRADVRSLPRPSGGVYRDAGKPRAPASSTRWAPRAQNRSTHGARQAGHAFRSRKMAHAVISPSFLATEDSDQNPGNVLLWRVDPISGDLAENSRSPGDPGTFWLHAEHGQQGIGEMGILADYAKCAGVQPS
ncbi:MAG: hypothetical protein ACLR7Z_04525 [Bilophila wadsworthia]